VGKQTVGYQLIFIISRRTNLKRFDNIALLVLERLELGLWVNVSAVAGSVKQELALIITQQPASQVVIGDVDSEITRQKGSERADQAEEQLAACGRSTVASQRGLALFRDVDLAAKVSIDLHIPETHYL
jgi:hypothetical protein